MRKIIETKQNKTNHQYNDKSNRIDISRLTESRQENIKAKNDMMRSLPDKSDRLHDLSKPLERRIYKKNNDLGKTQQLYELFKNNYHHHHHKTFSQNDFEKWLSTNDEWQQKHEKKVKKAIEDREKSVKATAKPKITKLSVKLADIANMKQIPLSKKYLSIQNHDHNDEAISSSLLRLLKGTSEELGISLNVLNSASPKSVYKSKPNQSPRRAQRRFSDTSIVSPNNNNNRSSTSPRRSSISPRRSSLSLSPRRSSDLSVYDRLAIRGRLDAEKRISWTPPPKTDSFSPIISARSDRLARKRRERISRSLSEDRNLSTSRTSINHDSKIQSMSQLSTFLSRGRSRSLIEPDQGRANSASRNLSSSPFRGSDWNKSMINNNNDSPYTFKPSLVANETKKIMKKSKYTFEERTAKSVEEWSIKREAIAKINQQLGSPANFYRQPNINFAATASPTRHFSPSPAGKDGFSFGKDKRVLSTSKYELKKENNEFKKENKESNIILNQ